MVADLLPAQRHARVLVGDMVVPQEHWRLVRPKPGAQVIVRAVPAGGGDGKKDPMRTVLMIAVVIAASVAAPHIVAALAPEFAATASATSLAIAEGIAGAVVGLAGTMLVNALIPPAQPRLPQLSSQTRDSPTLFISGARNDERPFGVVPMVLGRHRMYPPRGAKVFTEIVGDEQYLRMLVVWGYGPVAISDLKIGETPIGNFEEVETETVYGYPDDPALTLFPDSVFEEPLNVQLTETGSWQTRTSQGEADELSVDVTWPQGLVRYDDAGNPTNRTVQVEVEYRETGSDDPWTVAGTITATDRRAAAIRHGLRWQVARGQYDVRLRRATPDASDTRTLDEVSWTALRTFTDEDPIAMPGLAKTAVRIKATGQLNGIVDRLNAVVTSVLPDWDSDTETWIERATQNPASLFRAILQGAANARPVPNSRLDLGQLQHWHELCEAQGRRFNMVVDYATSVRQCLSDCAAAGRASPSRPDGKHSVVIDEPKTSRVQLFTPRNSWGFQGQKAFVEAPHAWRVRFVNEEQGWLQDERIVYDDGFDENNATEFEGLELPGVTDPDQVWADARYFIAAGRLRPETYSLFADVENIVCTRGDWVGIAHDVLLVGLAWGRIKTVTTDGDGDVTALTVDQALPMELGVSYGISIRTVDDAALTVEVVTDPGEQTTIVLETPIPAAQAPAAGDLFAFGELGEEVLDVLVKRIEPGADLSARIVAVPLAPEVHDADTGPIPAYDPHVTVVDERPAQPAVKSTFTDDATVRYSEGGQLTADVVLVLEPPPIDGVRVSRYQAAYRLTGAGSLWRAVPSVEADSLEIAIPSLLVGEEYDLRVRAISERNVPSPWLELLGQVVAGTSEAIPVMPRVSGLELFDGANSTTFTGRDAKFVWRAAGLTGARGLDGQFGADQGGVDAFFKDYLVRVLTADGTLLRQETTTETQYSYTWEKNVEDGGPRRSFTVEVYQRGTLNQLSPKAARLTVSNPAPEAPTGLAAVASFKSIFATYNVPADTDWVGTIVHMSTETGFEPGPENLVWKDTGTAATLTGEPGTTYYLRVAAFDAFGDDDVNFASEIAVSTEQIEAIDITDGSIVGEKLANLAVTALKLANDAVEADKILDGAVGTAKIADAAIVSAKIANLAVGNAAIANLAVSTAKIQDLAVNTAKIGELAVTTAKIALLAVDTAQIADAAITNAKINGVIQSDDYDAGVAGWKIDKAGNAELNNAIFRGTLELDPGGDEERMVITNDRIRVYDDDDNLRVIIGNLS